MKQHKINLPQALQEGLQHHQAGRLQQAETIYKKILKVAPDNPDAYHLLGLVARQTGKIDIAVQLISEAIK